MKERVTRQSITGVMRLTNIKIIFTSLLSAVLLGFGIFGLTQPAIQRRVSMVHSAIQEIQENISRANTPAEAPASQTFLSEATIATAAKSVVLITAYKDVPVYSVEYVRGRRRVYAVQGEYLGTEERAVSAGTGFFVTRDGYIVTNKHVVSDTTAEYVVEADGAEIKATVVYRDPEEDVAVLKIHGTDYQPLTLGDSSEVKTGDTVITIGNAFGTYIDSVAPGIVTSVKEDIEAHSQRGGSAEDLSDLIETSAKLYPGDSGGPMLNSDGQVVGIDTAIAVGESVSYAVPSNIAKATLSAAGVSVE